jgi:hypothetical protein
MPDAEQSAIEQLAAAIGIVATGHRVARNQMACKELETAMVRWANAWLETKTPPSQVNASVAEGGLSDEEIASIRTWLASEKETIALFDKASKIYPCHSAIHTCEDLLDEVDRLRGRK